jgi:hypothetical protein
MDKRLTQVLLAIIIVLLSVQVAFQVTGALAKAIPVSQTKEQVSHQEYLKYFLDETTKRQDTYAADVYAPAVDTIYQQQLITLNYIFRELNAQTILMVQEQMEK